MDLQAIMNAMNASASQERGNYHLTLGDLVQVLETTDGTIKVVYDFSEEAHPSEPISYRGYYCDLAFPPSSEPITAAELLKEAKAAVGAEFEGYKGGDFTMQDDTPLWASPYGSANGIAIMDAKIIGERLVLITKQID